MNAHDVCITSRYALCRLNTQLLRDRVCVYMDSQQSMVTYECAANMNSSPCDFLVDIIHQTNEGQRSADT